MSTRELVRYRTPVHDSDRWRGFTFRAGDIVISTPPKSGTTWLQEICALLILQDPGREQALSSLSPWLDMLTRPRREVVSALQAQTHRRFIKTHTPLDGLPLDPSITYVCVGRDPRDVALSMGHHRDNLDIGAFIAARRAAAEADGVAQEPPGPPPLQPDGERDRFWRWVLDDTPPATVTSSLLSTLHHLQTFREAPRSLDVVMLHFDELRTDLEGSMRALADRLGIAVAEERWPELVRAARFEEMRARAALTAPDADRGLWHDSERFFHRGTTGQWGDLLDGEDLGLYLARVRAIGPSDLVDWVHRAML